MEESTSERRTCERIITENIYVDVSDGKGFFLGEIFDVSKFGLCMMDVPKALREDVEKMTVIVSGNGGRRFRMDVVAKWSTRDSRKKSVGVEILKPPRGWAEFVTKFIPINEDDVWGRNPL